MSSDLNTALSLLIIGMTTVFTILSLVVITGKVLIRMVNRFSPDIIPKPVLASPLEVDHNDTDESEIAAIVAAVEVITKGKGRIKSIDKITN